MEDKLIFIGALGGFFLAIASTKGSDRHKTGDLVIACLQTQNSPLNPARHDWLLERQKISAY